MRKSEKIKTKQAQVADILRNQPATRDNDRALIAAFWRIEQPLITFQTADALLRGLEAGRLSNPDDITRARRKVQAECPELRGHKKNERYTTADEVRQNINVSDAWNNMFGDTPEKLLQL
jgi:hypothetical protein